MALEVKRKEKESSQSLVRRFTKRVQQSGILFRARKIRFKGREKSKDQKKKTALRKEEMKKKYEELEKLGKTK
jgi:ribosomal protein S21